MEARKPGCPALLLRWTMSLALASLACDSDRPRVERAPDRAPPAPVVTAPAPTPDAGRSEEPVAARPDEHPVIFAYRAGLWARLGPPARVELDAVSTAHTQGAARPPLEYLLSDRVIRTLSPAALEAAGETTGANLLRHLAPVTSRPTCDRAMDALTTVSGATLMRARAASPTGEPPPALGAAVRASGHAGNACRAVAGLERVGADESTGSCDDNAALLQSRACRAAAGASVAGARAAAAVGGALEAVAAAAVAQHADPGAARAAMVRDALQLLRDVVAAAQSAAGGRRR